MIPDANEIVWDATTLTRMVGDNPAMHRRLLDKFLLGSEEQHVAIVGAIAAGDLASAASVAHKMKSAARTIGAMRLGRLCQDLEIAGRTGDVSAAGVHAAGLKAALQEVAVLIKNSYI